MEGREGLDGAWRRRGGGRRGSGVKRKIGLRADLLVLAGACGLVVATYMVETVLKLG